MESRVDAVRREHWLAVAALVVILAITALWWALALWPLPSSGGPEWLLRTRAVCFGTSATGLPDSYGWMTLIGQPILMLGMLYVLAGDALRGGLGALARLRVGRLALAAAATALFAALIAAGARVASAAGAAPSVVATGLAPEPQRLNQPAPRIDLLDQRGERVTIDRFRGRPVLLTFAYAHCETVCPLAVRDVLHARDLAADVRAVAIVLTLDPWRDTPARLPAIAERWRLSENAFVVSGDTGAVAATLDRWGVARQRDLRTGDVTHATIVYVIARDGRIAYALSGNVGGEALAELARRP